MYFANQEDPLVLAGLRVKLCMTRLALTGPIKGESLASSGF